MEELKMRFADANDDFCFISLFVKSTGKNTSKEIMFEQIEDNVYITRIAFTHIQDYKHEEITKLKDTFAILEKIKEFAKNKVHLLTYFEPNRDVFIQMTIAKDVVRDIFMQV